MPKDHRRIQLGEIPRLSSDDLLLMSAEIKADMTSMHVQIEQWNAGEAPIHLDNDEWRSKVGKAMNVKKTQLAEIKLEQTRRRIATSSDATPESRAHAFVQAAKMIVGKDVFAKIWELASELNPNIFDRNP